MDDDADPESGHFVFRVEGNVVGTGTVRRRRTPANQPGWQIRGMAVEQGQRGRGIGSVVLSGLLGHVAAHGGGVVWCYARARSRTLYERHGFESTGEEINDPVAGAQVLMQLPIGRTDRH